MESNANTDSNNITKPKKEFPYKYVILGLPILLSLFASVPAIIAIKTNNAEYRASSRVAEAKIQLADIVDLILKNDQLNLNLLELGYNPEGKLENIYGVNPKCFPKFQYTNMLQLTELSKPIPLFKWPKEIMDQKTNIERTFNSLPCPKDGNIKVYALYVDDNKLIKGWTIDLQKNVEVYNP
jgi:hypothetical protein